MVLFASVNKLSPVFFEDILPASVLVSRVPSCFVEHRPHRARAPHSTQTHVKRASAYCVFALMPSSRVRFNSRAFIATSNDEPDIEIAAISGRRTSPKAG
jgi:hypothetical protein